MQQAGDSPVEDDPAAALLDLRRLPLDALLRSESAALDEALTRQLENMGRPGENYAAHGTTPTP